MIYRSCNAHCFSFDQNKVVIITAGRNHLGAGIHNSQPILHQEAVA